MTELSSPSLVSTISAGSSSAHRPRPPNAPRPPTKPFTARRSKIVQSPYLTTSTPKKVAATEQREKWASSVWSNPNFNSDTLWQTLMKLPGNSSVLSPSKKRKRCHSSSVTHMPGAGDPFEVSREDLQEELQSVKRELNTVGHERDVVQARLRKAEEDIGQKDKQIEELLASGAISSGDALRIAGGKAEAFVSSLRLKIHTLQTALREKEKEMAVLHQDMRSTRLNEAEVAVEVYYQEVCRLQKLLERLHAEFQGPSPRSYLEAQTKVQALEEGVARLSKRLEEAESDNGCLKDELERALEKPVQWTGHSEKGYRGSIADKYADHDRAKMLSVIVDLELKAQESNRTVQSLCREFEEKRGFYEGKISQANDKYAEASQALEDLENKRKMAEEVQEKLRGTIKKLKEDRTHYRSLAEQTQTQLADAREELQKMAAIQRSTLEELTSLRQVHQDELLAREHAQKLASRRSGVTSLNRLRQDCAAATIQRYWRKSRAMLKQKQFQESLTRAVLDIQCALRAHATRRRALEVVPLPPSSPDSLTSVSSEGLSEEEEEVEEEEEEGGGDDVESDVSGEVEVIQCALRAHQSRRMAMLNLTTILSDVDTSGNVSTTTTSSDEDTASLVDFHSANRVPSPPTFDTPTPVDKPHPPHQICTSSQEPLVPPPQPHGTPCVPFSTHERSRPPNDPPPSDQTRPSNEPHPLDQAHSTAESFTQTCPSDGSLQERGGVEAWRTPDSIKEVHVVMSSLVEYTSPPPRPHPLGEAPSVGHNQPPVKVSHANGSSRRCWVRSADKGNLCSKSLCAIGHAKLDVDRSRSSCQVAAGSSSSDVEGTFCDSPEGVLLAEELP